MANVKKEDKIEKTNNTKDTLLKKNKEQEDTIKSLKDENKENKDTLKSLQEQIQTLQTVLLQMKSGTVKPEDDKNKQFEIGCRFINGVTIYSPKRDVSLEIPYNVLTQASEYEINMILQNPMMKNFFEKGVVYFIDKGAYDHFRIYEHIDLSDDKIISLIKDSSPNELIEELIKVTRNKREDALMHSIFYRIVELYKSNKLSFMTYETKKGIETFFKCKIENAMMMLNDFERVR